MTYATFDQMRLLIKLPSTITANDVSEHITRADRQLQRDIAVEVRDEQPYGTVDGSNVNFWLDNRFIADIDFTGTVTSADIAVYFWTDTADASTKTVQSSANYTIDANNGRITFTTAPSVDTAAKITVDYSFYRTKPDFVLIKEAASLLACANYAAYEWGLMPEDYMLGPLRVRLRSGFGLSPYERIYEWYQSLVAQIRGIEHFATLPEDLPESGTTREQRLVAKEE